VHRTQAIYRLDYFEIRAIHEAQAAREGAPVVAKSEAS